MIRINLLEERTASDKMTKFDAAHYKRNPSAGKRIIAKSSRNSPKQYLMGLTLGAGFIFSSILNPVMRRPVVYDFHNYVTQSQQQSTNQSTNNNPKHEFSIAKQDNSAFSLKAFKPKSAEELYRQKKEPAEKPAVLDSLDAKIGDYVFVIDQEEQTGTMYKLDYQEIAKVPVSTGKNPGDKEKEGDYKTPRGVFEVIAVANSSKWRYDEEYAYGPYFARLNYELNGASSIGVHGTNEPEKLGFRASHGCVRTPDEFVRGCVEQGWLKPGTRVAIVDNNNDVPYSRSYYEVTSPANYADYTHEHYSSGNPSIDYVVNKIMNLKKSKDKEITMMESKEAGTKDIGTKDIQWYKTNKQSSSTSNTSKK